jgi:hypothetical protein
VFEKRTLGVGFSSASDGISCITCIIYPRSPRSLKNRWHLGHLAMIFHLRTISCIYPRFRVSQMIMTSWGRFAVCRNSVLLNKHHEFHHLKQETKKSKTT